MNTEQWANAFAFACFPAVNLFVLLYGAYAPWWRSWTGRAVITTILGLAVLIDSAVVYRLNHKLPYPYQAQMLLAAFGLIALGTNLYLLAFVSEQFVKRNRPPRPEMPS